MGRVLVVGAGLSGLACAYELRRSGRDVVLLEASARPGGVVGGIEVGGFRFETGPNTIAASARTFRELCVELDIADRWILSSAEAKARYLWHDGRLTPVPAGPGDLFRTPLLSGAGKRRLLTEPLRRFRHVAPEQTEPTLAEFVTDRLGEEAMRRFAAPFVRGIYAGEIERLGARSAFPRLWKLANEHGGLLRGAIRGRKKQQPIPVPEIPRGRLVSFPRGLSELVEALATAIGPGLRTNTPVESLRRVDGGGWSVRLSSGEELDGDELVLAVQAPKAGELFATLGADAPRSAKQALDSIVHASVTLVHLGLDESGLSGRKRGFGYLVPPDAAAGSPRVLGTVFVSDLFDGRVPAGEEGRAFAASAFYRTSELAEHAEGDSTAIRVACEDLARAFSLPAIPEPRAAKVVRWNGVIPQYGVGHAERMAALEAELDASFAGLHLAGSSIAGVSVDDVLARGRAIGKKLSTRTPSQKAPAAEEACA